MGHLRQLPRVMVGGPDCSKPYSMALVTVSAMSFGALSATAIRVLDKGLVREIGSGYFGTRTEDGRFDEEQFTAEDEPRSGHVRVHQTEPGATPGIGGVLPGVKVTKQIAQGRGVPQGRKCISPVTRTAFGGALNPITDAIRGEVSIEWIGVRHEEAAALAAGAQLPTGNDSR